MAYCEVEDVKARAGRLKDAWDDTTPVNDADIERFIRDAGATVDVALAAHGFDAPALDARVTGALVPVVADIALLTLLTATWPGGNGPASVSDAIQQVRLRVEGNDGKGGYLGALASGDIGFLMYLREIEQGGTEGSADFWSSETDYSSWLDDLQSGPLKLTHDGDGVILRGRLGPLFHKDMKL